MAVGHGVDAAAEGHVVGADAHAVLAIADAVAGGEDVDVGAFRTEFAITL